LSAPLVLVCCRLFSPPPTAARITPPGRTRRVPSPTYLPLETYYHIWTYNPRFYSLLLGSLADLFALERDKALAALGEAFTNALTQSHTASKFDGKEGGGGCVERFAAGGGDKAYRAAWQGVAERGTLSSSMASIEAGIEVFSFISRLFCVPCCALGVEPPAHRLMLEPSFPPYRWRSFY